MRILCVTAGWGIAALIVWLSVTPSPPQISIEQGDKLGYRTYDVYDMCANAVGVVIGWTVSFAIPMGLARKLR